MRIACVIPGCRRGTSRFPDSDEIICGPHWRAVPAATKRRKARIRRELRRFFAIAEAQGWALSNDQHRYGARLYRAASLAWRRAKAQAIQAAAGIG